MDWDHWLPLSRLDDLPSHKQKPGTINEESLRRFDFDVLTLKSRVEVKACVLHIFEMAQVAAALSLDQRALESVVTEITERYLPNPYHNLWHAADVT